jgi:pyridoxal phosphate phosphatase PHOSPHO2
MSKKKSMLIFDMDQTILDLDTEFSCVEKYAPDLVKEMNGDLYVKDHWIEFNNYLYERMKKNNVTWEEIVKYFQEMNLSPNFEDLFNYIRNNSSKFDCIIVTGNNDIVVDIVLESHNIKDCFKKILCNKSYLDKENYIKIEPVNEKYEHCKDCSPFLCKSLFMEDYWKENNKDEYERIIYFGDGGNDLCLSKKLTEKDFVFPRKNYKLYKLLFNENIKNEIKAKIFPWENGKEIIDIFKTL